MSRGTKLRDLTLLLGSTTTVLASVIISPSLPGMVAAFADVPNAEILVKLTLTMPALFIAIGALFAGILLDKWGRKPVVILSLVIYGLAGTAGFFLESLPAILFSRALLGIAVAGIMSGLTTLILDLFEGSELNKFLGLQGAMVGLGGMFFLLTAGWLANIRWNYPFLIHLFAFLILPGVIYAVDEPRLKAVTPAALTPFKIPFNWRKLGPIYLIAFLGMSIFFIFPVQVPFYLAENSDFRGSQVGLALSLQSLSSVIIALQFQRLKAVGSFRAIFSLVFLTFSLNHFILSLSSSYVIVLLGLLIGGAGIGLFPPNTNGWLAQLAPIELRGKAVGGLTSMLFLGQFFSPILTQPIIDWIGLKGMFTAAGAAALFLAVYFAFGTARQNRVSLPEVEQDYFHSKRNRQEASKNKTTA